ncbi:hypothetical protein [Xylanibacter muris]|uniref:hypothetical protein n=1 Tax=Xylanibacter muris TaxID=2736290 RepID=UPI0020A61FE0|nr:hypothetical protein [Xylanibacter muris]
MKSYYFCCVLHLWVFAQETSEHLRFKGVPIDGTLSEYVAKMKQAGFPHVDTEDGIALLRGDFAGFKGCTVLVSTLKSTNKVNTIGVIFPEMDKLASLENNYTCLKTMQTEKYGEPFECVEKFQGYVSLKTDSDKLHALRMDRCKWYTVYSTSQGNIELSIGN